MVLNDTKSILHQLNSLERLVQQFLELSRIRHIQSKDIEPLDYGALVKKAVSTFTSRAEAKHITIDYQAPTHLIEIISSETALLRVLHNLIDNAIKYTPDQGTVTLHLTLTNHHKQLTIIDTGMGMSEEELCHIYDPFYRADRARQQGDGFGMGLPMTKELVTLLNGKLVIESQFHHGTTVNLIME